MFRWYPLGAVKSGGEKSPLHSELTSWIRSNHRQTAHTAHIEQWAFVLTFSEFTSPGLKLGGTEGQNFRVKHKLEQVSLELAIRRSVVTWLGWQPIHTAPTHPSNYVLGPSLSTIPEDEFSCSTIPEDEFSCWIIKTSTKVIEILW